MSADWESMMVVCLHLARAAEARRQMAERDRLLVLGGVAASHLGLNLAAAACRRRILAANPGHILGRHASFAAALGDESFQSLLKQIRRSYPPEKLEHMLAALEIDPANERALYADLAEYAAALMGFTPETLEQADRRVAPPEGDPLPPLNRFGWRQLLWVALLVAALTAAAIIGLRAGG